MVATPGNFQSPYTLAKSDSEPAHPPGMPLAGYPWNFTYTGPGEDAPLRMYNYTPEENYTGQSVTYVEDEPGQMAPKDWPNINSPNKLSIDELRYIVHMAQRGPRPLVNEETGADPGPDTILDYQNKVRRGEITPK